MEMKILIVIPAYNEELNIERVVSNLINNYPQYDYVIVNDGSTDKTGVICRKHGWNLIDLPVNLGLTGAVQAGMKYAVKHGYDAVLQYDGDGQHRAEFIEKMKEEMVSSNAEIIIGSRFVSEKKPSSLRMLGGNIISMIIKLSTGQKITDPTSGMRLFGKNVLLEFSRDINYGPEPDTISYLIKQGVKVEEIQVYMDERIAGESYLNVIRSIKYMVLMSFSILFIQNFRRGRK
ncbi:undecaprenyl-phosphate mannosyltransferase [Lachnospiraceae bacterium]|nr:undecaprenyl-phosphate mannosyltransferase [Lachnospiraceae bacterium]